MTYRHCPRCLERVVRTSTRLVLYGHEYERIESMLENQDRCYYLWEANVLNKVRFVTELKTFVMAIGGFV